MAREPQITFDGNCGAMPELKTTASGKTLFKVGVAVTPGRKQADGTYLDGDTMWFGVTSFDQLDPIDFPKGTRVKVTGRLTQRVADNGKTYNDVIADSIEIVQRETQKVATPSTWKQAAAAPAYSDDEMPF